MDIGDYKKKQKKNTQDKIMSSLSESSGGKHISKISEDVGMSRQTASRNLKELEDKGKVKKTREIGSAKLFDVNEE